MKLLFRHSTLPSTSSLSIILTRNPGHLDVFGGVKESRRRDDV
jgi:hypothetical protein